MRFCLQPLHGMLLMPQIISLLILGVLVVFVLPTTAEADQALLPQALHGCSDHCGNVTIPYPFGMAKGCYRGPEFFINCTTGTTPDEEPIPYLTKRSGTDNLIQIHVTNISLKGELHVLQPITRACDADLNVGLETDLPLPPPFTFSNTKNNFFTIGCGSSGNLLGFRPGLGLDGHTLSNIHRYCFTFCDDNSSGNDTDLVITDDSCSGFACSLSSLPSGVQYISIILSRSMPTNWDSSYPCRYAFLAEKSEFTFSPNTSFQQLSNTSHLPVVVNWEIGDHGPCDLEQRSKHVDFACKGNSTCINWPNVIRPTGYICQCKEGYQGNPYLPDGCQDIDECKSNPCYAGSCVNTPGNYSCICPNGMKGRSCKDKSKTIVIIVMGISVILALLVGSSCSIYWGMKQRRYIKLKEKYFQDNGGLLLQQKLANHGVETTRIFCAEELEKATNNYDDSRVLGKGSYGIVYKGILPNNRTVAIKKSKIGAPTQSEQFVNELVVLSEINHRNVVRLLGCCLETEVPLLVYEFITNGTLFEHVHGKENKRSSLTWELRLKIAAETAGALAYLHFSTFMQIIHRDVKAMNILLDENYTAKVSDFGASVLIPLDQTEIVTFVEGTLGYLDPAYLQSNQLTEKSDVYSFGVVLAELLTSKVPFSYDRPESERSLARMFVCAVEEERLNHILDSDIVSEGNIETVRNVACLAKRCLKLKGEERPTMREVATELEGMRIMANHPRGTNADDDLGPEDQTSLSLGSPSNTSDDDVRGDCGPCTTITTGTTSRCGRMQIEMLIMSLID